MRRRRMYNPNAEEVSSARPQAKREKKRTDPQVRAKAEELAATGMPFQLAMAVALGRVDLNTALERMARDQKVDRVMAKYDLGRALATQVVLEQADLTTILAQRRMSDHREKNRFRSCLDENLSSGLVMSYSLHGGRVIEGRVVAVEPYQARLKANESGVVEDIHKLQFKYACASADVSRVAKLMSRDPELTANPKAPILRPQDRYSISDKRLFQISDQSLTMEATLLEGELFKGSLDWFGRFELGFTLTDGSTKVHLFRHALNRVRTES